MRGATVIGFAAVFATTVATAIAQPAPDGFKMPSGNIHCQYFAGMQGEASVLRCDIRNIASLPPRPRDCELDWGRAFEIAEDGGAAQRICAGDTVADDALPALPYGSIWRQGGFVCRSERNGATCINAAGHGFFLSRAAQRLF